MFVAYTRTRKIINSNAVRLITEDADGESRPGCKDEINHDGAEVALVRQPDPHDHGPQDLRELGVGQRERPQPKVGGGVRH